MALALAAEFLPRFNSLVASGIPMLEAAYEATFAPQVDYIVHVVEEPDSPSQTHRVIEVDRATGEEIDRFFTNDPHGLMAAAAEREEYPELEDRFALYAERGW